MISGGTISALGANLRIDIMGTTTSMMINGFFTGGGSTYEQQTEFELSDSGLKLDSQLANLVSAMASFETSDASARDDAAARGATRRASARAGTSPTLLPIPVN